MPVLWKEHFNDQLRDSKCAVRKGASGRGFNSQNLQRARPRLAHIIFQIAKKPNQLINFFSGGFNQRKAGAR